MSSIDDAQRLEFLLEARRVLNEQIKDVRARVAGKQRRRPRNVIPPCGTESAYQRHRYYDQPRCDPCWAAHAEHNRKVG